MTSRVSKRTRGNKRSKKMPRKSMPRRRSKDMRRPNRSKHFAQRSRTRRSSRHRAYAHPVETNFDMFDRDVRYGSSWFPKSFSSTSALWKRFRITSEITSEESNTAASAVFASPEIVNIIARSVFETSGNVEDVINFARAYRMSRDQTRNMLLDLAQASSPICTSEDYELGTQLRTWCTYDAFANFCKNQFNVDVKPERFRISDEDEFQIRIRNRQLNAADKATFLQENCFHTDCFRVDQKPVGHYKSTLIRLVDYFFPGVFPNLPILQTDPISRDLHHQQVGPEIPNDGLFTSREIVDFFKIPKVREIFGKILEAERTLRLVSIANLLRCKEDKQHDFGAFSFMIDIKEAAFIELRHYKEPLPCLGNNDEDVAFGKIGIGMERFESLGQMWCEILSKYKTFKVRFIVNCAFNDLAHHQFILPHAVETMRRYKLTPFQSIITEYCKKRNPKEYTLLVQFIGQGFPNYDTVIKIPPFKVLIKAPARGVDQPGEVRDVILPPYSFYLGELFDPGTFELL